MSNKTTTMHLQMSIDFALGAAKCRRDHPWHSGHLHDGTPNVKIRQVLGVEHMSFDEVIAELQKMKDAGFKVIPGAGCDHNPDGTCPGHVNRGIHAGKVHAHA